MNNDFLKRLYWVCSDQEALFGDGLDLGELYQRIADTGKATHCFSEALCAAGLPAKEKNLLDNISCSIATVYEQQGFINGFRLGMKLAGELTEEEGRA